ncbi:MAG: ABC transporter permease [Ignavibacteriales bacterium]|nr:ABC transporter permease [Ignavibacteriales bacterium]
MSISWFIAKRYIQAHRRTGFLSFITTIAILGVMLGTASLIITLSILDGFEREIKEKVVGFTSHIEVQGYQNRPVEDYASSVRRLNQEIAGIRAVSPFAAREGMIRSGNAVDGIYLKGIDPLMNVLTYSQHLVEGSFISADRKGLPQLVIGRKLANRLNAAIGQNLVVFALPQATAESVPMPTRTCTMHRNSSRWGMLSPASISL